MRMEPYKQVKSCSSGWWDGSPPSGLDLSETRFVLDFAFAVACAWHHFGIADFLLDRGAERRWQCTGVSGR